MNAPSLAVLLTWALALAWFCVVGAWAGALARPAVGVLGAVRVSLWIGFGVVTAFVLAAGLIWPLRGSAAVAASIVLTVVAVAIWVLVRLRRGPVAAAGLVLTRSWWAVVPVLALVVVAVVAAHSVFGPVTNYDTGLYHLNAIQYAQDFPTIHGLANLHTRLGTNVSAFNLAAFGSNTFWGDDAFRLVAGLFVMTGFADVALRVLDGGARTWRRPGTYVLVLALAAAIPLLLHDPGYRIASPSPDTMAMVVTIVAGAYLVDALATREHAWTAVAIVVAALAASTRTQLWVVFAMTAVVLLVSWALARRRHERPDLGSRALVVAGSVLAVATGVLMAVRDVILSGWLLFPASYLPMPVDWRVPKAAADSTRDWILSWARDTSVGPDKTLASWYWLGSWFTRTLEDNWVRAGLALLVVGVIVWAVAAVAGRRLGAGQADDQADKADQSPTGGVGGWPVLVLALLPTLAGLGAWFFTAPDPRFAWGSLLLLGAIPAGLAFVRLRVLWPTFGDDRPGPAGVIATGLLALVAVPYGVAQARAAGDLTAAIPTEIRTYEAGPVTVVAAVAPLARPPIEAYRLGDGNDIGLTQGGDQCWAFTPCMPYPNDALRFRGPTLADGFTTVETPAP